MTEETEEKQKDYTYSIYFCYEWMDMDSCIEYLVEYPELLGEEDHGMLIEDVILSHGSFVVAEDGAVINLSQFKQAWVKLVTDEELEKETENKFAKFTVLH